MPTKNAMIEVVKHVESIIENLDDKQIDTMISAISSAERIFIMGAGRSGLAGRAFAMRLVQMGLTAYVVGEVVTPAVTKNDLLVVVSGSGVTTSVISAAKITRDIGAKVLAITSYSDSMLGGLADYIVEIKGRTKIDIEKDHLKHQLEGRHSTLTPLGTLFEDTVMIFFDGIIAGLMSKLGKGEDDLKRRHATVE
ncbi:MAG: 6-phospho 3-hexuloisomerase [Candidatus Altiarchaeales archaeon IMC4]|nr:MAG: 6-phospho 3-hexuloisomerase [Candidatus Altiarchaeales archaeon IMC4]